MRPPSMNYDDWMDEVIRLSKVKTFDRLDKEVLREMWLSRYEPIVAVAVMHDLRNGGEGVTAEDEDVMA